MVWYEEGEEAREEKIRKSVGERRVLSETDEHDTTYDILTFTTHTQTEKGDDEATKNGETTRWEELQSLAPVHFLTFILLSDGDDDDDDGADS